MNTKQFADALDENLFSDKIFKKIYVFYAFWIVLAPVVETLFHCVGLTVDIMVSLMIVSALFFFTKLLELVLNYKKIRLKFSSINSILLFSLFVWFLISTIVNKAINENFLFGIGYFVCLIVFLNIDKKYYKQIAVVFIIEMSFNTILGLIDLKNMFIPGFAGTDNYAMSMQFGNPNWSGFVVIIAEVACLWLVYDSKKNWQKVLFYVGYIVMAIGLFVGGSYAPEMSLFLCELAIVIYLWIKYKKCPWLILSMLISTIFISFVVWFVPAFREVTTASANFFYESLGVIDTNLNTNLVESVSSFFHKLFGWNKFSTVAGADGWNRDSLISQTFKDILASPKSFMFGYGAKYIHTIVRVHNVFVVLWVEFGLPALLLFVAICVMLLVRFIKVKKTDLMVFLFSSFCMMLFEFFFCCIEPYCFPFFVCLGAILYRHLYSAELKNSKTKDGVKREEVDKINTVENKEILNSSVADEN